MQHLFISCPRVLQLWRSFYLPEGIIRNSDGIWIAGFSSNLGHSEVSVAEAWTTYYGLKLAWQLGLRQIIVNLILLYLLI